MTRGAECLRHALLGAGEDVAAGAHGAPDEDGLAGQLVVYWYEGMVGREGPRGAFPVHQQPLPPALDYVLLHLGDVVRHVVDDVHVEVVWSGVEHLGEGLPGQEGHTAPVDPGKVGGCCHPVEIVLTLLGLYPGAGQLPVVHLDVVSLHGLLHGDQSVCRHLVSKPSAAAVNHQHDLSSPLYAHVPRRELVVNLVHDLLVTV